MKYLLASLIIFLASPAHAEWSELYSNDDVTIFYDSDRITIEGDQVFIWILGDTKEESVIKYHQIDCAKNRIQSLQSTIFMGRMGTGEPVKQPAEPWEYPLPNTVL